MSVRLDVYKERRVVLVGFERAKDGAPEAGKPDLDVRGSLAPQLAHIVSVMQGDKVTVRLRRYHLQSSAKLVVTSADASVAKVTHPAKGEVPASATADVEIEGVAGGNPRETKLQVRFGSDTGPILHELAVWCYSKLTVKVTPHVVTVSQTGGGAAAVPSGASVADVLVVAQAIWRPYGVVFSVQATVNDTVPLGAAGLVNDTPYPGEVSTILGTSWVRNTINVYFVPQIGTAGVLGYGFSRGVFAAHGVANPGILLGDKTPWIVHDTEWSGNDLAHEAGHFFGLEHVDRKNAVATIRQDYWARRNLMHNNNRTTAMTDWRDDLGYGQLAGRGRRGGLVTHKNLATIGNDAQGTIARATILAGPY